MTSRRTFVSRSLGLLAISLVPSPSQARPAVALSWKPRDPDPADNVPGVGDMDYVRALEDFDVPYPATRPDPRVAIRKGVRSGIPIVLYTTVADIYGETLNCRTSLPDYPPDHPDYLSPAHRAVWSPAHVVELHRDAIIFQRDHPPRRLWDAARASGITPTSGYSKIVA